MITQAQFAEEQAERLCQEWHESLQRRCDKAAGRFPRYSDLSESEAYDLGSAILRKYVKKVSHSTQFSLLHQHP